ncbi:MAG: bifunctional homocysteine S-methyltransferase/methylenetetrahydrofolate reductase [Candidatus Marinimicrobia bacterium]|nr:bifunctional homocysteine S-methyltransferase/methylenetetrahydrofolate reductase [Candidatus Neomarinimicrobiota bacterium]
MAADRKDLLAAVEEKVLLCDGAMGTMIYESGVFVNRCFDELNLNEGQLITSIHEHYIQAGADIIETNTFGANRFKLEKFGLDGKVDEINRKAVGHAAKAVGEKNVFILGAVGPLGRPIVANRGITPDQAHDAFAEQVAALLAAGVDGLVFETISRLGEMAIALEAAREVSGDIPIIGQFSFADENNILAGGSIQEVVDLLEAKGADIMGANCAVGPRTLLEVITRMASLTDKPISVLPNAGHPEYVDGRLIYFATADYFAKYAKRFVNAGASIVGGCCGTTPAHIKSMGAAVRALGKGERSVIHVQPAKEAERMPVVPLADCSPLGKKLVEGNFVVSVEIDPPKGLDLAKTAEGARLLQQSGIDVANIADGPRATARISAQSMGLILEKELGLETILHTSCRDRNLLGLQSDMLGAHTTGFRNILAVTGDPPLMGDYPSATGVFDIDAIGLVTLLRNLNQGLDMGGRSMKGQTAFTIGVAVNPAAQNPDREMDRLKRKIEAGADFMMTQPIYDLDLLDTFLNSVRPLQIPALIGILPLASYRNAEFLHNEVPGMTIPDDVRERMRLAEDNAADEGIEIAREMLLEVRKSAQGVYIMPPFNRFTTALKVLEVVMEGGKFPPGGPAAVGSTKN